MNGDANIWVMYGTPWTGTQTCQLFNVTLHPVAQKSYRTQTKLPRHPSVDQFIWTMFTRQCLSLSGIKSALSSCKDDGWSVFSHGTGEITCLFRSLNSSLKLERLVGSWDSSSALGECVKVQIYVQCFPSLLLQKLELFTNWNQTSSLKVITLHVNFWWTIQGFCLP